MRGRGRAGEGYPRRSAQRKHCFVSFRDLSRSHIAPIPIFPSFCCERDDPPPLVATAAALFSPPLPPAPPPVRRKWRRIISTLEFASFAKRTRRVIINGKLREIYVKFEQVKSSIMRERMEVNTGRINILKMKIEVGEMKWRLMSLSRDRARRSPTSVINTGICRLACHVNASRRNAIAFLAVSINLSRGLTEKTRGCNRCICNRLYSYSPYSSFTTSVCVTRD